LSEEDFDAIELKDVEVECRRLYSNVLTEDKIKEISKKIMKMNDMQNEVYEIVNDVSNMIDDKNVIGNVFRSIAKRVKENPDVN